MMIDLTPLDVRKKRGDFSKSLRGYDPAEVDGFILMVAERMESLVKENLTLQERADRLQEQVASQEGREHAVREALVTAQELRQDMREQARREAELVRREAEAEVERILGEARKRLHESREGLEEIERSRKRFLRSFRGMLERELDSIEVEEARKPLEDVPLEIDFKVKDLRSPVAGRRPEGADPAREEHAAPEEKPAAEGPPPAENHTAPEAGSEDPAAAAPESAPERQAAGGDESDESLWLSAVLEEDAEREGDDWS